MSTFDDIIRNAMADFEGQACLPCNLEALPAASPNNQLNTSDSNNGGFFGQGTGFDRSCHIAVVAEDVHRYADIVDLTMNNDNDKAEPETVDSGRQGGSLPTSVSSLVDETDIAASYSAADGTDSQSSFDDWLKEQCSKELEFPYEELQEEILHVRGSSISTVTTEMSDISEMEFQAGFGRKSADEGKAAAFYTPLLDALRVIYQPCNCLCYLGGYCTQNIPGRIPLELRLDYFGDEQEPAPKDKARSEKILGYLRKSRQDVHGNLIFDVEGHEVCLMAFLRLLGASSSVDKNKAPGQWQRLIKGFLKCRDPDSQDTLLNEADLEIESGLEYTEKKGHAKTFIMDIMTYYAETLPTVSSDDGDTEAMQIPYSKIKDVFFEYEFHCHAFGIGKVERASYSTFLRAWNELYKDGQGVVKLLGGKSGFQTCAICNNFLAVKRSACCKRDLITKECLQKLNRLHLLQQSTERQHAEFFLSECKKLQHGQPIQAYVDIDPQSTWAGNTPKMSKIRTSKENACIENRNIGARVVCGPIDEYISICTDNLIAKGANILVEATKFCMEYIAKRLSEFNMIMPRKIGLQYDNSGENKNKEMFCYFSHIIEERYFDELEVMFLIVGHTHNILDQWFSVLAKAIRNAHFIGSVIAIHELYKIAHNEKKEHLRPALVHQMRTFHDWRRMYAPVLNEDIHNYGIPHRFKFTIDDQIGVAMMQYMPFSPPYGLKLGEKWHPTPTELGVRNTRVDGDIVLTPLMVFNGPDEVLKALGAKDQTTSDLAVGTQKERDAADDINHIMPILRELEVRAVGESAIRMQQEADVGASEETVTVSFTTLKQIEQLISKGNAKKDGNGRIVWLRRSKIAATDPNWLDKRPDVLPNPRLWNERIANAPVPVVPVNTTGEQPPTVVPAETPAQATIRKKLTADATESQLRLLNFQKAAADIAVTSSHIIKLVEKSGGIELSAKTNIKDATNNFQKAVLTTREHFWYKANCNGRQITAATEALVAVEEAKPWKLLDFPEITPEQKRHMAEIARLRAETAAQVEANLRGLLLRPGEGEYDPTLQVINFDGFAAAETKDVSKMLRAALVGIAKTFMKMAPGEIKKLNVEQLREKVKAYVALHPDVVQFPSQQAILASQAATAAATAESESTDPSPSQAQGADSGSAAPVTEQPSSSSDSRREPETCCVIECEGVARPMVRCPECELVFCVELHGPHSSHSLQTLRAGSIPHHTMEIVLPEDTINSEIASDASPLISESSEPEREREPEIIAEPMADEPDVPVVVPDVITRACKRLLPPQAPGPESISTSQPARESILDTDASEPEAHLLLVQPPSAEQTVPSVPPVTKMRRLEGDNPSHREHLEVTKLEDAVGFIRELRRLRVIQGRPAMYDRIHLLSKYRSESCYDIAFLYQLGKEFGVDMSVVMKTKRQSHKVVLEYLVSKLFVD